METKTPYSGHLKRPKTPAEMRAVSVAVKEIKQELELAKQWYKAIQKYEECRREIEKLTSEAEALFFKTEAEIDEYVMKALLAKDEYAAHFREWTARLAQERGYISKDADRKIAEVQSAFAHKLRVRLAKSENIKKVFKANADAAIEDDNDATEVKTDKTAAKLRAVAKRQAKMFTDGEDMEAIEAEGSKVTFKLLDRLVG